jgi:hypothetical protein
MAEMADAVEMAGAEPVMVRIGQAVQLGQSGERAAARVLFAEIWQSIGAEFGDPLHRCAVAHSMADVQDDVNDELVWDLRALAAADLVTDERAQAVGVVGSVAGFYPSLHLNLGDCYRRMGDSVRARAHLNRGMAVVGALADDGYGQLIKGGLDRLARRLESAGGPL